MSDYIFNTMTGKPEKKERLTPEDCWGDGCDPEILTVGKFCRWCHAKKPYHSHCPIPAWAADRKEKAYLAEALTNVNNRLSMAQARIEALEKVPVITMGDACPACGACDYICRDCGAAALRGEEER